MDSRFRGNDGGNPHILREKLSLEFPQNDRKKVHSIPAKFRENKIYHFRENEGISPKIKFSIPAKFRENKIHHFREKDYFSEIMN